MTNINGPTRFKKIQLGVLAISVMLLAFIGLMLLIHFMSHNSRPYTDYEYMSVKCIPEPDNEFSKAKPQFDKMKTNAAAGKYVYDGFTMQDHVIVNSALREVQMEVRTNKCNRSNQGIK